MAVGDSARIIEVAAVDGKVSHRQLNDALRQLCLMVYKLEGRLGAIELRNDVQIVGESESPLSMTEAGQAAGYHEVAFTGIESEGVNLTKGAQFEGEKVQARDTVGVVLRMDREGFKFYVNDDVEVGDFYPLNQVASIDSTGAFTSFPPAARIYNSTNTTILNNTTDTVSFDTVVFDQDDMFDVLNAGLTVSRTGLYLFGYSIDWELIIGVRQTRGAFMRLNSTDAVRYGESQVETPLNVNSIRQNGSALEYITAGTIIQLRAYSNDPGATDGVITATANTSPVLWAYYVGDLDV